MVLYPCYWGGGDIKARKTGLLMNKRFQKRPAIMEQV